MTGLWHQSERTRERQEKIVATAVRLFAQRGYHATSICEIADAVPIGRGALYYHIRSKEDLLFEIHNRWVDPMIAYAEELLNKDWPAPEKLVALSSKLLRVIVDYRDWVIVFYREMAAFSHRRFRELVKKRRAFEDLIQRIVEEGITAGSLRNTDSRLVVMGFLGLHNWAFYWLRGEGRLTPEEVAQNFAAMLLWGIAEGGAANSGAICRYAGASSHAIESKAADATEVKAG